MISIVTFLARFHFTLFLGALLFSGSRRYRFILFFIALFWCEATVAQEIDFLRSGTIRVIEVDFTAPDPIKIKIKRDGYPDQTYPSPAWSENSPSSPVAFVSGHSVKVLAKFTGCKGPIYIKGDGPGIYDPPISSKPIKIDPNTSIGLYEESLPTFEANKVDFFEPFEITWYYSNTAIGPWALVVNKSENLLMVTHKEPLSKAPNNVTAPISLSNWLTDIVNPEWI